MEHTPLEAIGEGNEAPVGMGGKSFGENKFRLEPSEGVNGCEGMGMVDNHDKGRSLCRVKKVGTDSPPKCFFQFGYCGIG